MLVVEFKTVALAEVFEPDAFGPVLQLSLDFPLETAADVAVGGNGAAEEAQHFRSAEVLHAVRDQCRVDAGESGGGLEEQVGRILGSRTEMTPMRPSLTRSRSASRRARCPLCSSPAILGCGASRARTLAKKSPCDGGTAG
jgi:hypothetical protein